MATYAVSPPTGSVWTRSDNGAYLVWLQTNQVRDTEGGWAAGQQLGQFTASIETGGPTPQFVLTAAASLPARGTVNPSSGTYPAGMSVDLSATPAPHAIALTPFAPLRVATHDDVIVVLGVTDGVEGEARVTQGLRAQTVLAVGVSARTGQKVLVECHGG